jgi:hypothetical protein
MYASPILLLLKVFDFGVAVSVVKTSPHTISYSTKKNSCTRKVFYYIP